MPTDREIEAAAKAIHQARFSEDDQRPSWEVVKHKKPFYDQAKAALEAAEAVKLDIRESKLGDILYGNLLPTPPVGSKDEN